MAFGPKLRLIRSQLTVLFHNLLSLECDQQKKEKKVIDQAYMCAHARLITFFSLLDRQEKEGWPRVQALDGLHEFLWTSVRKKRRLMPLKAFQLVQ